MDAYRNTAPARGRSRAVTVVAIALFASAAVAAVALTWADRHRSPVTYTPAAQPRTGFGASPESWPEESEGAQDQLDFTHRDDLAALDLAGQYAAEIAAPAARTGPAAVLAEHQRLRRELASDEHPVVLLRGADLEHPAGAGAGWVTFAVGEFPDADAVTAWCRTTGLPHCVPRRLAPAR